MPRRSNPERRRATRTALFRAARQILAAQARGPGAFTIAEIARRARLSRGAFYHYFKGLPDFLTALSAQEHGAIRLPKRPDGRPILSRAIAAYIGALQAQGRASTLQAIGPYYPPKPDKDPMITISKHLEGAIIRGHLRPLPFAALCQQMAALIQGAAQAIAAGADQAEHLFVLKQLMDGLDPRPKPPKVRAPGPRIRAL